MMYNNKFAVAIKNKGKVLREFKDKVYIPFGAEYSILLKNLNSVKALVNVYIDGKDVTGGGLVVYPNSETELERSLANQNLDVGNKFKFIERIGSIEEFRGVGIEDGIIRVEYKFEKVQPVATNSTVYHYHYDFYGSPVKRYLTGGVGDAPNYLGIYNAVNLNSSVASSDVTRGSVLASASYTPTASLPKNEAGITVEGGKSEQKFNTVLSFLTEDQTHVIVLQLLGETGDNRPVRESVTVKTRHRCPNCGSYNHYNAKFCSECGTGLEIYG